MSSLTKATVQRWLIKQFWRVLERYSRDAVLYSKVVGFISAQTNCLNADEVHYCAKLAAFKQLKRGNGIIPLAPADWAFRVYNDAFSNSLALGFEGTQQIIDSRQQQQVYVNFRDLSLSAWKSYRAIVRVPASGC
jgi:hypothetical protein